MWRKKNSPSCTSCGTALAPSNPYCLHNSVLILIYIDEKIKYSINSARLSLSLSLSLSLFSLFHNLSLSLSPVKNKTNIRQSNTPTANVAKKSPLPRTSWGTALAPSNPYCLHNSRYLYLSMLTIKTNI